MADIKGKSPSYLFLNVNLYLKDELIVEYLIME